MKPQTGQPPSLGDKEKRPHRASPAQTLTTAQRPFPGTSGGIWAQTQRAQTRSHPVPSAATGLPECPGHGAPNSHQSPHSCAHRRRGAEGVRLSSRPRTELTWAPSRDPEPTSGRMLTRLSLPAAPRKFNNEKKRAFFITHLCYGENTVKRAA